MEEQHQEHEERVRSSSSSKKNRKIDRETIANIRKYENKSPQEIQNRIEELEKEWDIERLLETNMSTLALIGIALTILVHEYWIILPLVVLLFFLQHALQGWCPPLPIFRSMGKMTRAELDREKYALKVLRGDFKNVPRPGAPGNPEMIFKATTKD
ncbi:hypothetical protein APR41_16910 [Salegentibacter salinarum]|uniref:DUF2892 domain-containing protein n=1 Tax=Salegentibacter salinarum TaxID=447422 RepID=A0A2N0TWK1_9FLAO|nr:hypothetical protein [Salegentibacter salinarum]PKD19127.1 hypothetical protein APR41_16910 [Salegentibacter salinarum]SKB95623.1 hypothetical protein SAMN05660903_03469 [Salegentibacter salinarum]